jgi:hypothetical protein
MIMIKNIQMIMIMLSKAVGIVLCIYYIVNYNDYSIGWNFSIWLMSSWVSQLNSILATFGTFILVLPLSIIATSILIENKYLNIMSVIFSISGGIVSMMISAHNGTLQEYSNFKLFVIYHAMTLEEKRIVFIREYKVAMVTLVEDSEKKLDYLIESTKKLDYLRGRLSDMYMAVYDNALIKMPAKDVKSYAINTVNDLIMNYENKQPGILKRMASGIGSFIYNHPKEIGYTILTIAVLLGGYKLIMMFLRDDGDLHKVSGHIARDGAGLSQQAVEVAIDGAKVDQGMIDTISTMIASVIKPIAELQVKMVSDMQTMFIILGKGKTDIDNLDYTLKRLTLILKKFMEIPKTTLIL